MKDYKPVLYVSVTWILTLILAYAAGWWNGVSDTARAATSAANSSIPIIFWAMALIAVIAAVAAFRARGYLQRHLQGRKSPSDFEGPVIRH